MKYIIITIFMVMIMSTVNADVYYVYDKTSKEIISISNEDDCVVTDNMGIHIDKTKDIKEIYLAYPPQMYKFKNNNISPNMDKIVKNNKYVEDIYEKQQETISINNRMKKLAIESLKSEGKTFKYKHGDE